jgi:hypothetical protein
MHKLPPIKSYPSTPKKHVPHVDSVNYHDVVTLVESLRPAYNPKMIIVHDDEIVIRVLNKMRVGLRKLKKGEK